MDWTKKLGAGLLALMVAVPSGAVNVIAEETETPEAGVVIAENTDYPDSDANYQVTFTYKASSEDVESVSLVGNWTFYTEDQVDVLIGGTDIEYTLPYAYKDGMFNTGYAVGVKSAGYAPIEMENLGNGYFQVTVPLPGQEYFYGFAENGDLSAIKKDPANMPVANGDSDSGWSLIWVGNGEDCLEGQEYIYPRTDDKVGTLSFETYTAVDGTEQPYGIYLPYGYDESEEYKVLYLSHGGGGNEVEWMYIGSAKNIFDNAIANGDVEPTIVVTMDNQIWAWDMAKISDNMRNYLIPAIEAKYSVQKNKDGRAFAGLSQGGYTATSEAVKSPDLYRYFGILSENYRAKDLILEQASEEELQGLDGNVYYHSVGWVDNGNGSQDRRGTVAYVEEILKKYTHNYTFDWKKGAHDWGVWRAQLTTLAKDILWTAETEEPEPGVVVTENTDYPESDANYQVTFTYKASSEDVESVSLVGNWTFYTEDQVDVLIGGTDIEYTLPYAYKDGMFNTGYAVGVKSAGYAPIEMENLGNGYFQVTVPLPGQEYFYGFAENGDLSAIKKDPENMPVANGDSDSGWSLIWVGNGEDCLEGQEYIYPRTDDKVGTLSFETYTAVDGTEQPYGIYLPYGYDESEEYKVLYLSHGGGGNEVEWMYIGSAKNIFDNAIANGDVEPTIVVTMDNQIWAWDMAKISDNMRNYLIPAIEAKYSVQKNKDGRAFAGLSQGGYTATSEAVKSPDLYRYFGILSENYRAKDLILEQASEEELQALDGNIYYHSCGWVDNGNGSQDRRGTVAYVEEILKKYTHNYTFDWKKGAHDWGVWRAQLTTLAKDILWTAETEEPEAGVVVTENPDTESNSGNIATFTFKTDEDYEKVTVFGGFQFFTAEDGDKYLAGETEGLAAKDAFAAAEAEEVMYPYGYSPVDTPAQFEYELTEITDGVWQTSLPLPSDQYFYAYNVYKDGEATKVEDPANPYTLNPVNGNNSGWCVFYAGTPETALENMDLTFPREDEQVGTYEYVPYTNVNGLETSVVVYLPYGYDKANTYKTLYISHGGGGNEMDWPTVGAVKNIFDNAIAEGYVEPTIVVSMNNTEFGWNYEQIQANLEEVLFPMMEEKYNASAEAGDRAFSGLSMGGLTTTYLYQHAADKFGYFGIWSATQVFEVKDVPNFDKPVVMLGAGDMDFGNGAYPGLIEKAAEAGLNWADDMYYVHDGHNWYAWPQLLSIFAKDYLWEEKKPDAGVVVTENPDTESNSGNIATFTFKTDEDYEKVTVFGGFQFFTAEDGDKYLAGEREGLAAKDAFEAAEAEEVMYPYGYSPVDTPAQFEYELTEIMDGVWQTSLPLPSDQYFYAYNVYKDGEATKVEDPANPYTLNPVNGNNSGWCVFYAGTPETALENMDLTFPREDEQVGTYEYVPYTNVNGLETSVVVYLPYGYDKANTYPTLYISHGGGGNEMDWPTVGAVKNIFDNAIAEGYVEPTIVVSMNNTEFGWNYEQIQANLEEVLFPMMEEKYNASAEAGDRAFSGLSMGGLTTTYLYQHAADKFGYFGIWSATQVFEVKDVPNFYKPVVMLGAGDMDFGNGAYPGLIEKAAEAGLSWADDMYYVHDGHNWYAWPQLLSIFAKDYLWEEAKVREPGVVVAENTDYPETDANYQATFTYKAPEGTQAVALIGNFHFYTADEVDLYVAEKEFKTYTPYEYKEGMYNTGYDVAAYGYMEFPMENVGDNVWKITMPLPGNQYFYDFVVTDAEGNKTTIKDPTNMPFANNGADSGHSLVYVGSKDDCIEGQEYVYPREDGKEGKVEYIDYTDVQGDARTIGVYVPYGYDESKTYKTLYLAHGGGGNEVEWFNIGSAKNIFDNLIAEGLVDETIVVTMNNTVYNFERGASVQNIVEVIKPMIEEKYSVSKEAEDRAIAGLSSGASVTAQAALTAIDEFDYYGIFSPSRTLNFIKDENGNNTVTPEQKESFRTAKNFYVSVGEFDSFVRRNVNVDLYNELVEDKASAEFFWKPGAHDWAVWRNQLTEFARDYLWEDIEPFEFDDVKDPERYFYDPVYWAYRHEAQITTGTRPNLFTPEGNVTRGQMVTFLWRLAGEPEPEGEVTFKDVDPERYYADPIAWAAENDITTGYADGSGNFGPDDNCTREQIVTFLWRYAGKPAPAETAEFTDTRANAYYLDALSWAAENEITLGLNDGTGRFGVSMSCTRAMSVTFLYRFAVK